MRILTLFLFLIIGLLVKSQEKTFNYHPPMKIPIKLAGNFGELRPNHFHTGLDYKTNREIGKKIYSIEDGFVSRISISHWGYGKAIYITHPNGFTSVYAHLNTFNDSIEKFVKNVQYYKQSETIDCYPGENQLKVKKGEVIAFSGNSGSSTAPHLHFEIRETTTEHPVNPLKYGINITDNISPEIHAIKLYPLNDTSFVENEQEAKVFTLKELTSKSISCYGQIGMAIHSIDRITGSRNSCGIFDVNLYVNDELFFQQNMEKLDFSTNRYINAHKDYELYHEERKSFHKSFLEPNNKLNIYKYVKKSNGIQVEHSKKYSMKYEVFDAHGNKNTLKFNLNGIKTSSKKDDIKQNRTPFYYDSINRFENDKVRIYLPKGSLYNNIDFNYENISSDEENYIASVHKIHNKNIPVHFYYTLMIKPEKKIDEKWVDKIVVIQQEENGFYSKGGKYIDGWIVCKVRNFGDFSLAIDTTNPFLKPLFETKNIKNSSLLKLKVADNLSGIDDYNTFLNGEWVLTSYLRKQGEIHIDFKQKRVQEKLKDGKNELLIVVKDERNNVNNYVITFEL